MPQSPPCQAARRSASGIRRRSRASAQSPPSCTLVAPRLIGIPVRSALPDPKLLRLRFVLRLCLWSFVGTFLLLVVAGQLPAAVQSLPTKLLVLVLGLWGYRRLRGVAEPEAARVPPRALGTVALLALPNLAASQACAFVLLVPLLLAGAHIAGPSAETASLGAALLALLVHVAATVPGEELLYRGALLPALRPLGDRFALVVSALLFGVAHVSLSGAFLWAFLLGLLTGLARLHSGSVLPGIVMHAAGNTLGVALMFSPALSGFLGSRLATSGAALTLAVSLAVLVAWGAITVTAYRSLAWRWPAPSALELPRRHVLTPSLVALVVLFVLVNVALTVAMFGDAG